MPNRIKELRVARGLTQSKLADQAGTSNQMIGLLEKGERQLTQDWMIRLSAVLNVQPAELIAEAPPPEPIYVRGKVQAGTWSEALEWEQNRRYPVWVPIPGHWKPLPKYGLEVHGPSMNRRYPEGTILVCVGILDADIEPKEGQRYIVQRESAGEFEMTVKELKIDKDGRPWLWPDSDDPEHQNPLAANGDDGDTIQILAIVITSVQPE